MNSRPPFALMAKTKSMKVAVAMAQHHLVLRRNGHPGAARHGDDPDELSPLRLHTPARTYKWASWTDLIADISTSIEIRNLILNVEIDDPGEPLIRAQAISRAVESKLAAHAALLEGDFDDER